MKKKFSPLLHFFPLMLFIVCTIALVACDVQQGKKPETLLYTLVYQVGEGGSIDGESEQKVLEGENGSPITAVPNEGYEFDKWSDGITTATRQETNIRNNFTVTASFQKKTYIVSYKAGENGTLQGETSQTVAHGDSATSVTAVPNEGYAFDKWSDGLTSATRTDKNIQESFSVIASFIKRVYTVRYETDGNGTIQGEVNQTVEHGGNAISVTAIPNEG